MIVFLHSKLERTSSLLFVVKSLLKGDECRMAFCSLCGIAMGEAQDVNQYSQRATFPWICTERYKAVYDREGELLVERQS